MTAWWGPLTTEDRAKLDAIDLGTPDDGSVLTYDAESGLWVPGPPGGSPAAADVSFDPTGLSHTDATDVQGAIADLDGAIGGGGGPTTISWTGYTATDTASSLNIASARPAGSGWRYWSGFTDAILAALNTQLGTSYARTSGHHYHIRALAATGETNAYVWGTTPSIGASGGTPFRGQYTGGAGGSYGLGGLLWNGTSSNFSAANPAVLDIVTDDAGDVVCSVSSTTATAFLLYAVRITDLGGTP